MAKVFFGINKANPKESVEWNTSSVVNGHWVIVGGSGSGKTHQIRAICGQLQTQDMRVYIFDPHGDIDTDPHYTSTVEFSEASPYGINPLVINPSPVYGGVRKRINTFIRTINRYSGKLSNREEAAMRYALRELYDLHGFDYSNPSTWQCGPRKKIPTLEDLHKFVYHKLRGFIVGHMYNLDIFERFNKGILDLRRLQRYKDPEEREQERDQNHTESEQESPDGIREELRNTFNDYTESLQEDELEQYVKYESKDVLKSLLDRIENLKNLGIFKPVPPPFDPSRPIWRYNMRSLYVEEQGYLVELTLEQIFSDAVQRGLRDEVDTLVFIDEAQRFLSSEDQDHIVSVIFREMRKFGGGLALATQNCSVFPTDIVINSGVKMILGVDEAYQDILAKTLGMERIRFIQPRKNASTQIKTRNSSAASRFVDTLLESVGHKDFEGLSEGAKEL